MDHPTGGRVGVVWKLQPLQGTGLVGSLTRLPSKTPQANGPDVAPRHADGFAVWLRLLNLQHQLFRTGAELLFEVFSQRYERGSIMVTTNLPFDEWTEVFGSERLTGALLDRLTHHVHFLEMNGESYRLKRSRENAAAQAPDESDNP